MNKLRHASLFSGIGGFEYAAKMNGIENVFAVEIDKFCQKVLRKNYPDLEIYSDIKEFKGEKYAGGIDILTGGFPCQPFSVAGKREGSKDDRALWYEMFRVIQETKPTWIIAENVPGLLTIEDGVVYEQCIFDLESEGYETCTFEIPAISVNAPHKRQRVWIVAHSLSGGCWKGRKSFELETVHRGGKNHTSTIEKSNSGKHPTNAVSSERQFLCGQNTGATYQGNSYNTSRTRNTCNTNKLRDKEPNECGENKGKESPGEVDSTRGGIQHYENTEWDRHWYEVAAELCRMDDGISAELHKLKTSDRVARLKALGNAIVPQVADKLFQAIIYAESNT